MDIFAWIIEHLLYYMFVFIGVILWAIIIATVVYTLYILYEQTVRDKK